MRLVMPSALIVHRMTISPMAYSCKCVHRTELLHVRIAHSSIGRLQTLVKELCVYAMEIYSKCECFFSVLLKVAVSCWQRMRLQQALKPLLIYNVSLQVGLIALAQLNEQSYVCV